MTTAQFVAANGSV